MARTLFAALLMACLMAGTACQGPKPENKTYVVASDATWPPMEMLDANKQVVGYSSDYLRAMEKEVPGLKFDIKNIAWDGIFAGLTAGNYDIVASSVTITPERQKQMLFTDPYAEIHQALVVQAGSPIATLQDLNGKKVGGQIGTTGIFVIQKANVGADVKEYEDVGLAMEDLANGRIDAVMCDDPVANYYANKHKDFTNKFKVALITPDAEYYGFAVQKGHEDVVKKLNEAIKAVKAKGIDKELLKKWTGA